MASLIVSGVLTFGVIISLITAHPTRVSREVDSFSASENPVPDCSVNQVRGGNLISSTQNVLSAPCIPLRFSDIPTDLEINCDGQVSNHVLQSFPNLGCRDEDPVEGKSLSTSGFSSLSVNERIPICSFRFGQSGQFTFPDHPVSVLFRYYTKEVHRYSNLRKGGECHNICGSRDVVNSIRRYPESVRILEKNGAVANNFVKLYSQRDCLELEDSIVKNSYQGTEFDNDEGRKLVAVTRRNTTKSYRITRIRSG